MSGMYEAVEPLTHEDRLLTFVEDGSTLDELLEEHKRLRDAAQAVVDEFGWSESIGYGLLIAALRAALEGDES